MFPKTKDAESLHSQPDVSSSVTPPIQGYFCGPKSRMCLRNVTTRRATMPKTTVNEDSELRFGEYKVRVASDSGRADFPASDPIPYERRPESILSGSVAAALHSAHGP